MARLSQPSEEVLGEVASQIGDRLHDEFQRRGRELPNFDAGSGIGDLAQYPFEMGETFEIWQLKADVERQLAETREDLLTLTRQSGAWHHQVIATVEGGQKKAVAFAQSRASGQGGDEWSVRDLYFSPLAARIDQAITLADEWVDDEAVARLLSLPEFKIEALWFLTLPSDTERPHPTSRVIVFFGPESSPMPQMSLISSQDFTRTLANMRLGMGLLI